MTLPFFFFSPDILQVKQQYNPSNATLKVQGRAKYFQRWYSPTNGQYGSLAGLVTPPVDNRPPSGLVCLPGPLARSQHQARPSRASDWPVQPETGDGALWQR